MEQDERQNPDIKRFVPEGKGRRIHDHAMKLTWSKLKHSKRQVRGNDRGLRCMNSQIRKQGADAGSSLEDIASSLQMQ